MVVRLIPGRVTTMSSLPGDVHKMLGNSTWYLDVSVALLLPATSPSSTLEPWGPMGMEVKVIVAST